ncbi:MAG: transcription termination factor Rho [Fuerstiella sp.]
MPSSSSSAEETKPKARRKTKAASSTKKKSAKSTTKKTSDAPELFSDDDFGDGVDSTTEETKPRKRVAKKKATRKKATLKKEASSGDEYQERAASESVRDDTASVLQEARSARFEDDMLSDIGDYFSASVEDFSDDQRPARTSERGERGERASTAGGEGTTGEDGERPRRRRRRRRRGSKPEGRTGGNESQNTSNANTAAPRQGGNSGQPRGGSQNSRGDNRGGGRQPDRGGRGGNRGGGGGGRQPDRGGDRGGRGRGAQAPRRGRAIQPSGEPIEGTFEGILELHPKGYGFLRDPKKNYAAEDSNPFVSSSVVEKYNLREGVMVKGEVGPGTRNQGPRLQEVELIDGYTLEEYEKVKHFDDLTPINPFEQIKLEIGPRPVTMRVMDLLCPIGKGQRALLVAPPRTGKTMLLQDIANSVSINHPEIHLMVLLIDERPEEVTEMSRSVKGEVIASSLDNDVESHVRIAQLIIERGKRLAEEGQDVFILLDSITRLARAFNKWVNPSGRTGRGGLDIRALDVPKKLFGTARRFDEGGSLTVCGTALIDTNNGMDEAIFQEFKGTGNMEMVLSRELADRRIWPSIDITRSGTRREEKILAPEILDGVTMLRRSLISLTPVDAMEQLTKTLLKFEDNKEFLSRIQAVL